MHLLPSAVEHFSFLILPLDCPKSHTRNVITTGDVRSSTLDRVHHLTWRQSRRSYAVSVLSSATEAMR